MPARDLQRFYTWIMERSVLVGPWNAEDSIVELSMYLVENGAINRKVEEEK